MKRYIESIVNQAIEHELPASFLIFEANKQKLKYKLEDLDAYFTAREVIDRPKTLQTLAQNDVLDVDSKTKKVLIKAKLS